MMQTVRCDVHSPIPLSGIHGGPVLVTAPAAKQCDGASHVYGFVAIDLNIVGLGIKFLMGTALSAWRLLL